jgi:hypothetical protein
VPSPYQIVDAGDGLFELQRSIAPNAPEADADETALAEGISHWLAWVRANAGIVPTPTPEQIQQLRAIAETGLTAQAGRDPGAALRSFRENFRIVEPAQGPTAGAFRVTFDATTGQINIERNPATPPTDDQRAFFDEFVRRERLVRGLIERGSEDPKRRTALIDLANKRLLWAAQLGLQDTQPDVRLARFALDGILADATQEGGQKVRAEYLQSLAVAYLLGNVVLWVGAGIFYFLTHSSCVFSYVAPEFAIPGVRLTLLVTAMLFLSIGAWLSTATRLQPDSPEVLSIIFSSTLNARLRVVIVFGFGLLAILLLYKQVIVFSFGAAGDSGFTTQSVLTKLSAAILTGGFLGLGEALLPEAVIQRSANLIAALTPR